MDVTVNKINTLPRSQQAKEAIQQYIQNMDLKQGTKLPREEVMAEMLGVSRITVRKAFDDLAAEGKIFRQQGRGTFVNVDSLNMKVTFNPVMEFTQMIQESGYTPSMKMLNLQILSGHKEIRELLHLSEEDKLIRADKAFFADDMLCVLSTDFYGMSLAGGEESFTQLSHYDKSVFPYIYEKSGREIVWDKVEIDTVISTDIKDFAKYLKEMNIGIRPYLYLKEINYGEDNEPMIYVEEYIDTSIIKYNMIRQKNIHYGKLEAISGRQEEV